MSAQVDVELVSRTAALDVDDEGEVPFVLAEVLTGPAEAERTNELSDLLQELSSHGSVHLTLRLAPTGILGVHSGGTMVDTHSVSRTLSYWLRHAPEVGGFALDAEGWASTDDVLAGLRSRFAGIDFDGLLRVVETNDKQRFEFSPDLARLRARQGHSVEVDLALSAVTPPRILYHGTSERFAAAIFGKGLLPMGRHHVHLSQDQETARRVGARRKGPIVLEVAARRMHEAGHRFFVTGNRVWLVDRVPPEFLARLESSR